MPAPSIDLEWWPPDGGEPTREERARELVAALCAIGGPVVEEAVADVRQRAHGDIKIVRGVAPISYLSRVKFESEMRTVCVGTVYADSGSDPPRCSLQLHRNDRLTWRRN